ncbi:MAG: polysaccharide biosynthesis protein [Egibacteraceae bacterium]
MLRKSSTQQRERSQITMRVAKAAAQIQSDVPLVALDAILVAATYVGLTLIGIADGETSRWSALRWFLPVAMLAHLGAHWLWGLYGPMWRHASVQEARRIVLASMCAGGALAVLFLPGEQSVPNSVVLLGGPLATVLVGTLRFHSRLFAFHRRSGDVEQIRVVVIGAGGSGGAIIREMLRQPDKGLAPVAVLDDDPRKHGRSVAGVPVAGGIDRLPAVACEHRAQQALMAIPSADRQLVRRVADAADTAGLPLKVLPSVSELVGGQVSVRDVRDLSIDDLLGRQQVVTDLAAVRRILHGRRVLITGAGGSIGAEIARQVASCAPAALLLLDHDETHLFDAAATLPGASTQLLADIRDAELIATLFARHRPEVVFHAAAHKHVPLLQDHPCEAVRTNVFGTANVMSAAAREGVERLVFVSTDKAVLPCSVMGASKRVGEFLTLSTAPPGSHYCVVRFGNVLGSRGSVIPTFMRQIQQGGPVTITDPRMTRFFMSIEEAVQLVLQAAAFSEGGEIYMLEMGEPVRIVDLAERMIRLSGRRVGADVPITITGIRSGEKLQEELRSPEETPRVTPHPSIVALYPRVPDREALARELARLHLTVRSHDDDTVAIQLMSLAAAPTQAFRARPLIAHGHERSEP